jgi:hypothetical protein
MSPPTVPQVSCPESGASIEIPEGIKNRLSPYIDLPEQLNAFPHLKHCGCITSAFWFGLRMIGRAGVLATSNRKPPLRVSYPFRP